jgi:hypothetical protein
LLFIDPNVQKPPARWRGENDRCRLRAQAFNTGHVTLLQQSNFAAGGRQTILHRITTMRRRPRPKLTQAVCGHFSVARHARHFRRPASASVAFRKRL